MKQQESLKDIVYHAVLNGILSGEYKPNQIINEQELVHKFGYSKTPIREALVALCNEGILRSFPRFGYQIISLSKEDISDILSYRLVLESGYLRKSLPKIDSAGLSALQQIDDVCHKSTDSFWEHWDANTIFHMKLLSFSENNYACAELARSMNILKRAYAQFYWDTWNQTIAITDIAHHQKILHAIDAKDTEAALRYLADDLNDFCF